MKRETKRIAIIGQGIIGLSSAMRLVNAGFDVEIFSKDELGSTCSMAAGAYWWPHQIYPKARVKCWAEASYKQYQADAEAGKAIKFVDHMRACIDPDENDYVRHIVGEWTKRSAADMGFDRGAIYELVVPIIDVPIYLINLKRKVAQRGVRFSLRHIKSFTELTKNFDLIVNCSGLGARSLAADPNVYPIKGQVVRMSKNHHITTSMRIHQKNDDITLILPRSSDIILGATSIEGDQSLNTCKQTTEDIIERCTQIMPELKNCSKIEAKVGLRPGRNEVRLELVKEHSPCPIIHNYGHGGGGYTVAWGCADEVLSLTNKVFQLD